ncbi:MAG: flagellar basal body-associated FliL family protein [Desulfobacterales bacterium]|nr:flagellar basal body-associated FliL family protein [Desulfobacterales bacterium]
MEESQEQKDLNKAIELDQLDLAELQKALPKKKEEGAPEDSQAIQEKGKDVKKKGLPLKIIIPVSAGLVILLIFFFVWKFLFTTKSHTKAIPKPPKPHELYVKIGPIIAGTDTEEEGKVKLTLEISCSTLELKKTISELNSQLKEEIQNYLKTKEVIELISKKNFDTLRVNLKKELMYLLELSSGIEEVYFSELIVY